MTRTKRNILILAIGILAIIAMIILLFLPLIRKPAVPAVSGNKPEAVLPSAPTVPKDGLSPEEQKQVIAKASLELEARRLSQLFSERYGSFTNQGGFENVSDLYPLMTVNMRRVSQAYVDAQKSAHPQSEYYGVTTKALSSSISSQSENKAVLSVKLQRQEYVGDVRDPKLSYPSATVALLRVGDAWKVDDLGFE